jgi:hypothetical protein
VVFQQRKWEVKFAPQLATATRRTVVTVSKDVMHLMNQVRRFDSQLSRNAYMAAQVDSNTLLRTAVGGGGSVGGNFAGNSSSSGGGALRERVSNAPRLENMSSAPAESETLENPEEADVHRPSASASGVGAQDEGGLADAAGEEGEEYEDEEEQYEGGDDDGNNAYG